MHTGRIALWLGWTLLAGAGCSSGGSSDPCNGVECSSRGFCTSAPGDAYCNCISGFHPVELTCVANDPGDACRGILCFDHGTCRVAADGPRCDCETGYANLTGPDCSTLECDLICAPVSASDGGDVGDDGAACVPAGSERCDGRDNDCDGLTDEDFDLDFDSANCGACGAVCADASRGAGVCVLGDCAMICVPGWADVDGDPANGCEAACVPDPAQPENECNGRDDDCDGSTDEDWTTVDSCGEGLCRRSSICHDGSIACRPRTPPAAADGTCDGIDDDCDGLTDEDCGGADADADADIDGGADADADAEDGAGDGVEADDGGAEVSLCGNGTVDPGEDCDTDSVPCGPCGSGSQSCLGDCTLDPACVGSSGCWPDNTRDCGFCGLGTQTCDSDCSWGSCSGGGSCSPDDTTSCGCVGTQTCSTSCSWGSCVGDHSCTDASSGGTVCPGGMGSRECPGDPSAFQRCTCSATGSWTSCATRCWT
jgi:hypothetical protein